MARSRRTRPPFGAIRMAARWSSLHNPQSEVLLTERLHQVAPEYLHQPLDLALMCGDRLELEVSQVVGEHEVERELFDGGLRRTSRKEDVERLELRDPFGCPFRRVRRVQQPSSRSGD